MCKKYGLNLESLKFLLKGRYPEDLYGLNNSIRGYNVNDDVIMSFICVGFNVVYENDWVKYEFKTKFGL